MTDALIRPIWIRFLPKQFSLRALLVVTAIAGIACWWLIQAPKSFVPMSKAKQVVVGMSRGELENLLGDPLMVGGDWKTYTYHYRVSQRPFGRNDLFLVIGIDNMTVDNITFEPNPKLAKSIDSQNED